MRSEILQTIFADSVATLTEILESNQGQLEEPTTANRSPQPQNIPPSYHRPPQQTAIYQQEPQEFRRQQATIGHQHLAQELPAIGNPYHNYDYTGRRTQTDPNPDRTQSTSQFPMNIPPHLNPGGRTQVGSPNRFHANMPNRQDLDRLGSPDRVPMFGVSPLKPLSPLKHQQHPPTRLQSPRPLRQQPEPVIRSAKSHELHRLAEEMGDDDDWNSYVFWFMSNYLIFLYAHKLLIVATLNFCRLFEFSSAMLTGYAGNRNPNYPPRPHPNQMPPDRRNIRDAHR